MEDWEIVSIEAELDRLRDEREKKGDSKLTPTAPSSNLGCGTILLMLFAGMLLFKAITEFFSLFFQR